MSEGYKEIITKIDKNVEQVISKYLNLEQEYKMLKNKNADLQSKLDLEKENIFKLEGKFEKLKSAKVFEQSDNNTDDIKSAKSRINKLVKEIDKCIALLNVN